MTKNETAKQSIAAVRRKSDSCILFCSLGKDSLVLLDMIYPQFERVVCVFMYFVEGLEHIERWVGWIRAKYPRVEFVQVPSNCRIAREQLVFMHDRAIRTICLAANDAKTMVAKVREGHDFIFTDDYSAMRPVYEKARAAYSV